MSSSFFKKRLSPIKPGDPIDYKDVDLLKKFITERGKILPRRVTGVSAKMHRKITREIKRPSVYEKPSERRRRKERERIKAMRQAQKKMRQKSRSRR